MFLRLLMLLPFKSGAAPWTGKRSLLVLEKGMPLISELAMIPVTTLADGWDPPKMSCIKKDNTGSCGPGFSTVALVAAAAPCPVVADVAAEPAIGATPATGATGVATGPSSAAGAATAAGASGSGGSTSSSSRPLGVTAGTWPLGKVLGVTVGAARFDG